MFGKFYFTQRIKDVSQQNYHIVNNTQIGDGNNFGGSQRVMLVVAFALKFWESDICQSVGAVWVVSTLIDDGDTLP